MEILVTATGSGGSCGGRIQLRQQSSALAAEGSHRRQWRHRMPEPNAGAARPREFHRVTGPAAVGGCHRWRRPRFRRPLLPRSLSLPLRPLSQTFEPDTTNSSG